MTLLNISTNALFGQLLLGLINGAFYAVLSLGLAVIFGLLNIINFAHGALYMTGAFVAWMLLNYLGLGYWYALVIAPVAVELIGTHRARMISPAVPARPPLRPAADLRPGPHHRRPVPQSLRRLRIALCHPQAAGRRRGTSVSCTCRSIAPGWIAASLVVCLATWYVIDYTKLGSYLRAATENPRLVGAFGINVPRLITLTYGFGVGLAAFAGVLAAPIYSVNPNMGAKLIVVVFAVVVIGGMGSILGSIVTGFGLGLVEGLTKVFYPEAASTVIFVIMAVVLLIKPQGLFGKAA